MLENKFLPDVHCSQQYSLWNKVEPAPSENKYSDRIISILVIPNEEHQVLILRFQNRCVPFWEGAPNFFHLSCRSPAFLSLWQTQQLLRPSLLRPEVLCLSFLHTSLFPRECFRSSVWVIMCVIRGVKVQFRMRDVLISMYMWVWGFVPIDLCGCTSAHVSLSVRVCVCVWKAANNGLSI